MPLKSYEQLTPRPIMSQEAALHLAKVASERCGVQVRYLAHESDPTIHFDVDLYNGQMREVPRVLGTGLVQIEMPPGDTTEIYQAAEHSRQDLAA